MKKIITVHFNSQATGSCILQKLQGCNYDEMHCEICNGRDKCFWDEWITYVPKQQFHYYKWKEDKPYPKIGEGTMCS